MAVGTGNGGGKLGISTPRVLEKINFQKEGYYLLFN
jgi:hypothetical protein